MRNAFNAVVNAVEEFDRSIGLARFADGERFKRNEIIKACNASYAQLTEAAREIEWHHERIKKATNTLPKLESYESQLRQSLWRAQENDFRDMMQTKCLDHERADFQKIESRSRERIVQGEKRLHQFFKTKQSTLKEFDLLVLPAAGEYTLSDDSDYDTASLPGTPTSCAPNL